jgi:hypothetical protein
LVIGVTLLIVVGVGGFLLLRSVEEPAPPVVVQPTPLPIPPPTPEPEPQPEPEPPAPEPIRPGIDTDSDGVTDIEETTIYGSDPRNPDTDGDSFIDGNEVLHLYDPTAADDARFVNTTTTAEYALDEAIRFLLPRAWMSVLSAEPEGRVVVPLSNGEAVAIRSAGFTDQAPTLNDVVKTILQLDNELFRPFTTKQGHEGLRDTTRRIVVLELSDKTGWAALIYDPGSARTTEYLRTFEMIVNSITMAPQP